jgi:hypothetical protein
MHLLVVSLTQSLEKRSVIDVSEIRAKVSALFFLRANDSPAHMESLLTHCTTYPGRALQGASDTCMDSQTEQDWACRTSILPCEGTKKRREK